MKKLQIDRNKLKIIINDIIKKNRKYIKKRDKLQDKLDKLYLSYDNDLINASKEIDNLLPEKYKVEYGVDFYGNIEDMELYNNDINYCSNDKKITIYKELLSWLNDSIEDIKFSL